MKTAVYSWRVSSELKADLENEARRRKLSLSAVLDLAARDWLGKGNPELTSDEKQLRLHETAAKCLGVLASGDTHRAENARQTIRQRLRNRHER